MEMRNQRAKQQDFQAANAARKKQIGDDTVKLLKLPRDLNAEIARHADEVLSPRVIRKADEIERLARDIQEKNETHGGAEPESACVSMKVQTQ